MIQLAKYSDLKTVLQITRETISKIYPKYYAKGVVAFFLQHHKQDNVIDDIENERVWLLEVDGNFAGTVTIKENTINRLFVLPEYQSHGFGSRLMDFAEGKISENYSQILLASSLSAKEMYLKRGYKEKRTCMIETDNGDILVYDEMEKLIACQQGKINYNCRHFVPKSNTENGEIDEKTIFHYFQDKDTFWAEYSGGDVEKGFIIGKAASNGELDFHYQHMNKDDQVRIGKCHSIPHILENGKIELHEKWQWLNGDMSCGESVITEK